MEKNYMRALHIAMNKGMFRKQIKGNLREGCFCGC